MASKALGTLQEIQLACSTNFADRGASFVLPSQFERSSCQLDADIKIIMSSPEDRDLEKSTNGTDYDKQESNVTTPAKGGEKNSRNDTEKKKILSPWVPYSRTLSKIFLVSCVIGVSIDPLFLYIPIVNEDRKCLTMDENMKIIALALRSVTDFTYLLHLIFRLQSALIAAKAFKLSLKTGFPWPYLLIDILAIIPLPQVIVLEYFSKITGSSSLTTRKFLNLLLLLQYVPRILRVYLCAKDLERAFDSVTRRVWVKGAFNFFLYVIVGHVFGALWYFYSIYRETACWHHACKSYPGCNPNPFDCRGNVPMHNLTFINEFCPTHPPNAEVFDFGIFVDAIASRMLSTTNFLNKFSRCFWWGLRNLSSFGSNLETSSNTEENLFAILISILGLLLFLYLIGNLQTYMQLATKNSEKIRVKINDKKPEIESYLSNHDLPNHKQKLILRYLGRSIKQGKDVDVKHLISLLEEHIENSQRPDHEHNEGFAEWVNNIVDEEKQKKDSKEQHAKLWIEKCNIPDDMGLKILQYVKLRMREGQDVDVRNLLSIIPTRLGIPVKKHLCFPILKKVPMLENMDEEAFNTICSYLKPMVYHENSFIFRKGEPLDFMLFITQGVVWTFGSNTNPMKRLQRDDYYGNELLEWQLRSTSYSNFPIATCNVKCHTKVEAFTLSSIDLDNVLIQCFSAVPDLETEDAKKAALGAMFARKVRHEL